jgi:predicted nucleotidyltransferase
MQLQRIDLQGVEARVRQVLVRFPAVSGAYLYGSCLEAFRPDSDIDLGLILAVDPASPLSDATDVEVEGQLGSLDGHPFHVMTLTADAVTFSFGVLHRGRMVYEADSDRVGDFVAQLAIAHDDLLPFLASYRRARERAFDGIG